MFRKLFLNSGEDGFKSRGNTSRTSTASENSQRAGRCFLKTVLIAFLFGTLLITTACAGFTGGKGGDFNTDFHKGKKGVEVRFSEGTVPKEVFEDTPFTPQMIIENKGATSLPPGNSLLSLTFDNFYLGYARPHDYNNKFNENGLLYQPSIFMVVNLFSLEGKSMYYPDGERKALPLAELKAKSIRGQRESPTTTIRSSICYNYNTLAVREVCVNLNAFSENERDQVCQGKEVSVGGTGGPVILDRIESEPTPVRVEQTSVVRPRFILHFTKARGGTVVSPKKEKLKRACMLEGLKKKEFNAFRIETFLGSSELKCTPELVELKEGEGSARCWLPDEDVKELIGKTSNYYSTLTVNASYLYKKTISKEVRIKRLPGDQGSGPSGELSDAQKQEVPYYKNGEQLCTYCQSHPDDEDCPESVPEGYSCSCSRDQCYKSENRDDCVFAKMCAGTNYCCDQSSIE